ncbi:tRNA glutamyl-Q(34) synthetase GluQRS, partial [Escherichia coli]|nr:tRNA glutamyl-Q(34) synthetase GluQRS [Escherichia coli]
MGAGRFAPSPSGPLHLGNLRTAILAWLFARSTQREFLLRIEDLDRVRSGAEATQIAELAALGIDFDGDMLRQSDRLPIYLEAVERLKARGLVYECYCSRKDI